MASVMECLYVQSEATVFAFTVCSHVHLHVCLHWSSVTHVNATRSLLTEIQGVCVFNRPAYFLSKVYDVKIHLTQTSMFVLHPRPPPQFLLENVSQCHMINIFNLVVQLPLCKILSLFIIIVFIINILKNNFSIIFLNSFSQADKCSKVIFYFVLNIVVVFVLNINVVPVLILLSLPLKLLLSLS